MIIGRLLGIKLRLNWFFLLLLGLLWLVEMLPQTLILFAIVLIHEYAHAVAAKGLGLKVRDVELLPFGGVARIDDIMEVDPVIEATVAIVGPLTNFFLAGLALLMARYVQAWPYMDFFVQSNLMLGAFNLVPALPLDGGRIYRAYLSRKIGFRSATERAVKLAKVLAFVFAGLGGFLLYQGRVNVSLIVVSFFVFFAADRERNLAPYVFLRYLSGKKDELREQGVMAAEQLVAAEFVPVKDLVRRFGPKRYHVVMVVDQDGNLARVLTEWEVINTFFEQGIETPIGEAVDRHS